MKSNSIELSMGQDEDNNLTGDTFLSSLPVEVLRKILAGLDYGTPDDLSNFALAVGDDDIANAAIQSTCKHLKDDMGFLRSIFESTESSAGLTKWLIANDWRGYDPSEMKRQIPVSTFTIATSDLNRLTFEENGVSLTRARYAQTVKAPTFASLKRWTALEGTLPAKGDPIIFANNQSCCWQTLRPRNFLATLANKPNAPSRVTFTFIKTPLERRLPRGVPLGLPFFVSDALDVGRIQLRESNDGSALFYDFSRGIGPPRVDNHRKTAHFPEEGSFLFEVEGKSCLGMPIHHASEILKHYHIVPRNPMFATYGRSIISLTFLPQDATSLFVYLQCALKFGLTPILRRFYEEKHIDANARIDHEGNTAFHLATQNLGNVGLVRYLLHELGANPSILNLDEKMPVDLLCDNHTNYMRWDSRFDEMLILLRPDGWSEKVQPSKEQKLPFRY